MRLLEGSLLRRLGLAVVLLLIIASATTIQAWAIAAIAQGFDTEEKGVVPGALMSLKPDSPKLVEFANTSRINQLLGVVADRPLLEIDGDKNLKIVTSGETLTLVSDINGDVKTGDKITASPIDGIGMKSPKSSLIVGTAQADLSSVKLIDKTVTDAAGDAQTVRVGLIPVQIGVGLHADSDSQAAFLPPLLQNFANSVAGKEVSALRVLIAALSLLLAFVSVAVLLYSSVKSSIISIGRNPLSETAVRKSLFGVGATVIGILLLTVITIYLILIT